jgi:hypothetical protein
MTPKEKAIKLVEKMIIYHSPDDKDYEAAKDCALIAVDEILKAAFYATNEIYQFYLEVKKEIELL